MIIILSMFKKLFNGPRIVFIIIILLAAGFIGYSWFSKKPQLETVTVKKEIITQVVSASGEIKPDDEVELKFPVSGKLVYLAVKKNQKVKKWQYLASLDKKELKKTMDKALYDYSKERWDFEQDKQVTYKDQVVTDTVKRILEKNQFDLDKTVIDVELSDFAAKNADLYSPIEGVVTKVHTQEGTSIIAGTTPIVTIADPEKIFFIAKVGESDIADVASGQQATIELDAFTNKKFSGKIVEVDYAATKTNGNKAYFVKISLDHNEKIKLDMSGEAEITTVSQPDVLVIPKSVVFEKNSKKYVQILENRQVKTKEITIGSKGRGGMIEIVSGLAEGDKIILPQIKK